MVLSRKINSDSVTGLFLNKVRIVWHLLFWCGAYFILLNIFSSSDTLDKIDAIYTGIFLVPIVISVYLNLYFLIPLLLRKEKLVLYAALLIILSLVTSGVIYMLFDRWIDHILKGYYFVSYLDYWELILYVSVFLVLTMLLKLSREWLIYLRKERTEKLFQLKNLQSQINPHFLLNSLQAIYSRALSRSEDTPDTILKLSEILKFTIYETRNELVPLERELEVLRDYIDMHRMRIDPDRADIRMTVEGDPGGLVIIPMLFQPFVENSFKHGIQGSEKEAFVHVDFKITGKNLTFTIENNRGAFDNWETHPGEGIGIENTRKRLEILYPNKHHMSIQDEEHVFRIILKLQLDNP